MMLTAIIAAVTVTVDFGNCIGKVRPELYSAGFGAQICSCPKPVIDEVKSMGFKASRTHDWALINPGQRVCDWHMMFPVEHLDAKDPKNYVFGPTDFLLKRNREELGHDIFFRLGTSIEHSPEKVHFNAAIPKDLDKVAEVFAGTVRHYNAGWGNGHKWDIRYWEIWNEPDGGNMWCLPEGDVKWDDFSPEGNAKREKRISLFCDFYVKCIKRLKGEFGDSIKVGGPALCDMKDDYFRRLFDACRKAGVKPDFISWHHYTDNPEYVMDAIARARALCDEYGFRDCELIINEWHYFGPYSWAELRSPEAEPLARVWQGPHGHNGIDSSCFNLFLLTKFQTSKLDQSYYYGCRNIGNWGYKDEKNRLYKVFHGFRMFKRVIDNGPLMFSAVSDDPSISAIAVSHENGLYKSMLLTGYRAEAGEIVVNVKDGDVKPKVWSAHLHDHEHDNVQVVMKIRDGQIRIKRPAEGSFAYFICF